jgi:hypothetical protein
MKPGFEMIVDAAMSAEDLADFHHRQAQFRRNLEWYEAHAGEIGERYAGKFICVAGQEVFSGETSQEARAKAYAAHPDDGGAFGEYVRVDKGPLVYARCR